LSEWRKKRIGIFARVVSLKGYVATTLIAPRSFSAQNSKNDSQERGRERERQNCEKELVKGMKKIKGIPFRKTQYCSEGQGDR